MLMLYIFYLNVVFASLKSELIFGYAQANLQFDYRTEHANENFPCKYGIRKC